MSTRRALFRAPKADAASTMVWRTGSSKGRVLVGSLEQLMLIVAAALSTLPIYAMLTASFKPREEFVLGSLDLPSTWTFENYSRAWGDLGFARMFFNSLVFSLLSAAIVTVIAALAAFAFAKLRFPGRRILLIGTIALMAIPAIVVIAPLFKLLSDLRMINSMPSAIIVEVGILVPFAIYLMFSYLRSLPDDLFKAAAVDGARSWQQFIYIVIPTTRPALATTAVTCAVFAWNDLLIPLIFWPLEDQQVLMVGLADIAPGRGAAIDIPLVMAAATISIAPLMFLFIVAQRAFIRGLVEGGLK